MKLTNGGKVLLVRSTCVVAMLEDNLCPPAHFAIKLHEKLETSEAYTSKPCEPNDIKSGRVVKNVIVYNISEVWTFSS